MTTITIKGFIHAVPAGQYAKPDHLPSKTNMTWWPYKKTYEPGAVMVVPHDITVEIPDDFDPRPDQIASLKEKQKDAAAAFHAFTVETNRQINELQAIEYVA